MTLARGTVGAARHWGEGLALADEVVLMRRILPQPECSLRTGQETAALHEAGQSKGHQNDHLTPLDRVTAFLIQQMKAQVPIVLVRSSVLFSQVQFRVLVSD